MIRNPNSKPGYCEEYDMEALQELAKMAFCYVAIENGCNTDMKFNRTIPGGEYSDFSCCVWELFTRTVRDGMELQKSLGS